MKKITYAQAIYLNNLLNLIPLSKLDNNIAAKLFLIKPTLNKVIKKFEFHKAYYVILNGGSEKLDNNGQFYYTEPTYKSKKEFEKEEDFLQELEKTKNAKENLTKSILELVDSESDYVINGNFTEEEFKTFSDIVNNIDILKIKNILLK